MGYEKKLLMQLNTLSDLWLSLSLAISDEHQIGIAWDLVLTAIYCFLVHSARCSYKPCLNGGKCTALIDKYVCTCREGFYGINCERKYQSSKHSGITFKLIQMHLIYVVD